jgi:hypothetical protein
MQTKSGTYSGPRSLRKPTGDTVPLSQLLHVIEERSFHGISSRLRICKQIDLCANKLVTLSL